MIYTKTSHSLKLLAIPLAITLAACSNNASDTNTVENEAKDKQNALNAGIKFTGKLPISPRVLTGKFENGITYIIRKNFHTIKSQRQHSYSISNLRLNIENK